MNNGQSPKEIYQLACASIAAEILPFGYKYLKSSQKLVKKDGDLTFEIHFSTNHHNRRGYLVEINIHTVIKSKKIKLFREESSDICTKNRPAQLMDSMFRDDQYLLKKQHGISRVWNLDDLKTRDEVKKEIVDVINAQVFKLFSLFDDHSKVIEKVVNHELRGVSYPHPAIDYLLCFSTPEKLKDCTIKYLEKISLMKRSIPHLDDFEEAYERLSKLDTEEFDKIKRNKDPVTYHIIKYKWGNLAKEIPNKQINQD